MLNGGELICSSGGLAYDTTMSGGDAVLLSGGTASELFVYSGVSVNVRSGGHVTSQVLYGSLATDGGFQPTFETVSSGAVVSATSAVSGANITLNGGTADSLFLISGGGAYVVSGGLTSNTLLEGAFFGAQRFINAFETVSAGRAWPASPASASLER